MRLKLLPFQQDASTQVIDTIISRIKAYDATRNDAHPLKTAFALTSVTGSGKSVIAATVIEALLRGSAEFATQPVEGLTVLWVSYDPSLCAQTHRVFATNADEIHPTRLKIIDSESFNERKLRPGHVYFLSLPLLGSANRLTRVTDQRSETFWDVLQATVKDADTNLLVVVDEAHIGMGSARSAASAKSLLESVITGHDDYTGAPLVWGISATPERFQRKIKQLLPESSGGDVVVKPADVQASGLLKQSVSLYIPNESASMHLTMLGQGVDELGHSTRDWREYCLTSGMAESDVVVPLMVAQLANRETGSSMKREDEMIKEIVRAARARIRGFSSKNIAHVIADRGPITVGDIVIDRVDPTLVQDRSDIQILIAKDAISTGWDCPRAEVLVSMRPFSDPTAITQMLGRMVRTPLARATGVDRLDRVSCWVPFFTPETVQHVVDVLMGEVDPDTGEDKASTSVEVNPQRFALGGNVHEEQVEVIEVDDDELVMDSDEFSDDVTGTSDATEAYTDDFTDAQLHSDSHSESDSETLSESDDLESFAHSVTGGAEPATPSPVVTRPHIKPRQPIRLGSNNKVVSAPKVVGESASASASGGPASNASRLSAADIALCVEAITSLPSYSIPTTRVVPVKRLLDIVSVFAAHGGPQDASAGTDAIRHLVRRLDAEAVAYKDEVAAARKEIITSDQRVVTATFDGMQRREMTISVEGGLDMVRNEFDAADRAMSGMAMEYYRVKFEEIHSTGEDPNEFELKADAAALAHVEPIVKAMNDEATAYGDKLLSSRSDSIALMAPAVRDRLEQLRLASRTPQVKTFTLSDAKTYSSRNKANVDAPLLPKHLYCDDNGMWPVPAVIAKNTWEMAVLRRETSRDEVIGWYRNPSTNAKDSLSIAYETAEDTWRTFQPDFLFVERTHDGTAKVAIVDPHWTIDKDGLSRMKSFATYVENNLDKLSRVNAVASIKGVAGLKRLNLQHENVRNAIQAATSVELLFIEHGEDYPTD